MKIVSDFHDYYDVVQASGQDQSLVYLRTRKEVELNRGNYPFPLFEGTARYEFRPRGVPLVQFVVGFCGKVYPILHLSCQRRSDPKPITEFCYTLSDVDNFVESNFKRVQVETYRSKPRRWRFAGNQWPSNQRRERFQEFFDAFAANRSTFARIFLENTCPIFVASSWWSDGKRNREYKIVYNECLKELDFFKVIDTYTAFQELQMFMGGMARPNKPIPQIPDKDMVSIKGFDEWSFRKPPQSGK